jgi:condensin complex subunit 2
MTTQAHRSETTLAKSIAQLQVKKLDLEFTVDPLFKKTSADFDEGGAMGLLMNHLGVDEKIRVVFDAGESRLENYDEEINNDVQSLPIDLTDLRSKSLSLEVLALPGPYRVLRFSQVYRLG